jgi:hypothetical protein
VKNARFNHVFWKLDGVFPNCTVETLIKVNQLISHTLRKAFNGMFCCMIKLPRLPNPQWMRYLWSGLFLLPEYWDERSTYFYHTKPIHLHNLIDFIIFRQFDKTSIAYSCVLITTSMVLKSFNILFLGCNFSVELTSNITINVLYPLGSLPCSRQNIVAITFHPFSANAKQHLSQFHPKLSYNYVLQSL